MQVGMVFNPGWTDAIVVVSEVLTRLPVWAQYLYAEYVLDQFKPTKWVMDASVVAIYPNTLAPDFCSSTRMLHRVTFTRSTSLYIRHRYGTLP